MQHVESSYSREARPCAPANSSTLPSRRSLIGGTIALAAMVALPKACLPDPQGQAIAWLEDWRRLGNGTRYHPENHTITLLTRMDDSADFERSDVMRRDLAGDPNRIAAVKDALRRYHDMTVINRIAA